MAARPRTTRKALNAEKPEKEKAKAREHDAGEVAPSSPLVPEHSKRPRLEVEASAVTTTSPSPLSVVRLNVGGARFETTLMTLTLMKGNYFEALFTRWEPRKEEDGSIFIDRDPKMFPFILNYLRGIQPPLRDMSEKNLYLLEREAEFYHLDMLCSMINRERERRAGPLERFRAPPEKSRFYCLDSTGLIAKKLHKDKVWNATVLGTLELRGGVHEWTVQISPDTPQDLMIGVTPVGADPSCVENCVTSGWYFYPRSTTDGGELWSGQEPKHTGTKWPTNGSYAWAKNMTIGTRLDFNAKTLSFCWEGKPYELAYQEINTLWPLCFCVIMAHPGKMVSLLSYKNLTPVPPGGESSLFD